MQSMIPGSVRDMSLMLEASGSNTPTGSPSRSPERYPGSGTPTPNSFERDTESPSDTPGPSLTPIVRPTAVRRPPQQSILGENTPPQSSTMLALQTMGSQSSLSTTPLKEAEPPLTDITNGSNNTMRGPQNLDALSSQILSLTSIATSLQKEMFQLSRRSRDNATDLLSLKEATNTRDEDIRKNLRDLLGQVTETSNRLSFNHHPSGLLLDNKPHNFDTQSTRGFQLPRIPSPKSFTDSIDRASVSTPSLAGASDAPGSVILLEKIIREMGTKDGQEMLVCRLEEVAKKLSGMATASKVDELTRDIRAQVTQSSLITAANTGRPSSSSGLELESQSRGPMTQRVEALLSRNDRRTSTPSVRGADLLNDDFIKILKSVKDSVAQGGGLTAEVKALVRELRGEVLGMGRELGRRLEQVTVEGHEDTTGPKRDEVSRVIDQGLEQMKDQLNHVLREHRRNSSQSAASQKSLVDYQEIYNAMRAALRDSEASRATDVPDLSRDDVIEAVRDAWENYKPEIEVQQLGLERDEVLACLKEGLQEYSSRDEKPPSATRDEVFTAVVEGLKHFVPPQVDSPASLSRDEIIEAVRDCLEEFEFPVAPSAIGTDITKADMVHAVREGLGELDLDRSRDRPSDEFNLANSESNLDIVSRLHDIMQMMREEFKAVSDEAKENVAANGRDTEQVLDATKDGFENLRVAMEGYVDRATGAAGQEDFMCGLLKTMEEFKEDIAQLLAGANDSSREQLSVELEGLRDMVNSTMVPATPASNVGTNNKDIMEALQTGLNSLRQEILRPKQDTTDILDALNEGLTEMRISIERITNKPVDLTANDEILDALRAGLDSVRSDIDGLRDNGNTDRAVVATIDDESHDQAIVPADMLKQDDIKNLEVLITQLRVKVEAMEPESHSETDNIHREDLSRLETMLENIQQNVDDMASREPATTQTRAVSTEDGEERVASGDAATREDVQAIETILRNTKASLDDLIDGEQAVRKEHLDAVETLVYDAREQLGSLTESMEAVSRKEDFLAIESLLSRISDGFDEMKEQAEKQEEDSEKVTKTDLEAVETVVLEIKTALDAFTGTDMANVSNKDDILKLEALVKDAKLKVDNYFDASEKALEVRQDELDTVGDRVTEVRSFLTEFRETVQTKLEDGATGVESLGKMLETMSEKMEQSNSEDLKVMFEAMKSEFEETRDVFTGAKLETDDKFQQATDSISLHIDDKITELMAKYDEYQTALDEKAQAGEETAAAVLDTKAIAEDLKLLTDTLGATVTESLEKMEEASRTVFEKVEELSSRAEENHGDHKSEHEQTRDHIQRTISVVEEVQSDLGNFQPQLLEAIKEVLTLVGQHYEHSKSSATDIADKLLEATPIEQPLLPAPEKYDDREVHEKLNQLVEQKYDDSDVRDRLEKLMDQKYDDSHLHEKLDRLVESSTVAEQNFSQLSSLGEVQQSVNKTAAEISEFVSSQTRRIADEHEDREKTLTETIVELERKLTEKEHVEVAVLSLKEEEERLRASVMNLRTEQESLIRQKTRLTGDVSSLETAMRLRKEMLSDMEHRAESLERRIVEGVMDHSRILLMSKSNKGRDNMSRKRVKKVMDDEIENVRTTPKPAVTMALSTKRNLAVPSPGSARRIVSLSQMNSNAQSGGVKRSQSVRTPLGGSKALRKRSWGGDLAKGFDLEDKENVGMSETVEELDEPETPAASQIEYAHEDTVLQSSVDGDDGEYSDAGTLRRSSRGSTVITSSTDLYDASEDGYTDQDGTASEWTESAVGSSVVSGSEVSEGLNEMVVYGQD